jgi:hypothetical protein
MKKAKNKQGVKKGIQDVAEKFLKNGVDDLPKFLQ